MVSGTVATVPEAGAAHRTWVALTKDAGVAASPPNLQSSPSPRPASSTGARCDPVTSMSVPPSRDPSFGFREVSVGAVVPSEVVKTTASSSTAASAEKEYPSSVTASATECVGSAEVGDLAGARVGVS